MLTYSDAYIMCELRALNKGIKKSAWGDKRAAMASLAAEAESAAQRSDSRAVYKCVRSLSGEKQRTGLRDADDNMLTGDEDQMRRWHQHFSGEGAAERDVAAQQAVHGEYVSPPSTQKILATIIHDRMYPIVD